MVVRWMGTVDEFALRGTLFDDLRLGGLLARQLQQAAKRSEAIRRAAVLEGVGLPNGVELPMLLLAGDCAICLYVTQADAIESAAGDRMLDALRLLAKAHGATKRLHVLGAVVPAGYLGKPATSGIARFVPVERVSDYLCAAKIETGGVDAQAWLSAPWASPRAKTGACPGAEFADALLSGSADKIAQLLPKLHKAGFPVYCTQDLGEAKAYCAARYEGVSTKTYGLLASSRARNLKDYGVDNAPKWNKTEPVAREALDANLWFGEGNGEAACRDFRRAATENDVAERSLDCSVLLWGDDLRWMNRWREADDAAAHRAQAYRTLLCASTEGCVLFLPLQHELLGTLRLLRDAGVPMLAARRTV